MDPLALCDIGAHITTGVFVGENGGSCSCCPDGALGKSNKFEKGAGEIKTKDGLNIYVTRGDNVQNDCVVLVFPDVYGYQSGRHQPMCDEFAKELNTKVYMPDIMGGDPIAKEGKGFWRQSLSIFKNTIDHPPDKVKRDIKNVVKFIVDECGSEVKICVVGYCWGFWAGSLGLTQVPELQRRGVALVGIHPVMMINRIFGKTGKGLADNVKVPTLLLTSGGDMQAIRPGGDIFNAFKDVNVLSKDYEDMKHGFVTRGEEGDEEEEEERKDVMKRAIDFLRTSISFKYKGVGCV